MEKNLKWLLIFFPALLLQPHPSHSHNGAVAIALPVEGITVDGDFSDWPEGMKEYEIALPEAGVAPRDETDFQGSFRIGYNSEENALYVAVEVRDESVIIDTTGEWNTQDGCELYVDVGRGPEDIRIIQYAARGDTLGSASFSREERWENVELGLQRTGNIHRYEWRIDIERASEGKIDLHPEMLLGIDVVACDKDEDGSFSWMAWGARIIKFSHPDRCGIVVLTEKEGWGTIVGRVRWKDVEKGIPRAGVKFESLTVEGLWIEARTNREGIYTAVLPAGTYKVEAAELGREKRESTIVELQEGREQRIDLELQGPRGVLLTDFREQGHWQTFGIPEGLGSLFIEKIFADQKGYLWFATVDGGVSRYDGLEFATFTMKDGLAHNDVFTIVEGRKGRLWFRTQGGMSRFDGRQDVGEQFTTFSSEDGLLPDNVEDIFRDRQGNLWFISWGSGVSRYDSRQDVGERFATFTTEDGLPSNEVLSVYEDRSGTLWIGTSEGLCRYDGSEFATITTADGQSAQHIGVMLEDQKGNLWLGGGIWFEYFRPLGGNLFQYNGKELIEYSAENGWVNNPIRSILEDRKGNLWFGTNGGAVRYDGNQVSIFTAQNGLSDEPVFTVVEARKGDLWFGTGNGVFRYDGRKFTAFSTQDGLASPWVRNIVEDREGNLWFGTNSGVNRYDEVQFTNFTFAGRPVGSIVEDRDGNLWCGTGEGILRYDGSDFTLFTTEDGVADNTVRSTLLDRNGHLWFATNGGVSQYDGEQFTNFTSEDGFSSYPRSLMTDRKGNLWFGHGGGIGRYDGRQDVGERVTPFTTRDGLANGAINAAIEDRRGFLWFGTEGGISRYDGRQDVGQQFVNFTTEDGLADSLVLAIVEDRDGNLWFGTRKGGVSRYDGRQDVGERFTTFTTLDGLTHNNVSSILEDRKGHLWFGTFGGGVTLYDGFVFQSLLERDGLVHNSVRDLHLDREGNVWIATQKGITRYSPQSISPPVYLTNVVAGRNYGAVKTLRVPSHQKQIAFKFQGISFRTHQLVYVYRLEGYDEEWLQTRKNRVEYADLPVGEYTFQVKAVDRDLNYSEEPATVDIEVFYRPVSSSIHISEVNIQDVFASFFKTYAEKPVGTVLVANDDPTPVEATLSFYIPDRMRRPTKQTVLLEPQSSQLVSLYAILDEEILGLEGANPAQAEISLSCELGEQTFSIRESRNITMYGRGALTWDDLGKAAAFVTPTDHAVSAFSRSLFEEYRSRVQRRDIDGNIPTAMLLFEALNAHGIKYARDASSPYSQVRGNRSAVDNIQYPGELLQSKMGDCDDCTVLYCALLENLDIPTALVDAPDHIFMMFDSGISEDRYFGFSLDEDRYVERDGRFWIPIEVTKLGEGSFIEAWELGAKTCQRLQNMDELVTDVRKVWPEYPYALPSIEEEIKPPDSEELERAFIDDMEELRVIREEYIERQYLHPLLENPTNYRRRMEFAHTLIESGDFNNAISTLMHLLDTDLRAEAYYFIGYSYAAKKNFKEAVYYIKKALGYDPENRGYKHSLEVLKGELIQ